MGYYLILDVGTTNVKAITFSSNKPILELQERPRVIHPEEGWVEEDPEELIEIIKKLIERTVEKLGLPDAVAITNQRSSTVVWDKETGEPYYNVVTWQDTRTRELVEYFSSRFIVRFGNAIGKILGGFSRLVPVIKRTRKGAYIITLAYVTFGTTHSSMHLKWLMENVEGMKNAINSKRLAFGTLDSWVAWSLTKRHVTDYTNASATGLFDPFYLKWSDNIAKVVGIPKHVLPELIRNDEIVGEMREYDIRLSTIIADQQASLYVAGVSRGSVKVTNGTGSFVDMNVGERPCPGHTGLYPMVALATRKRFLYLLEGSVITSGSAVDWLIEVGLMRDYSEISNAFKSSKESTLVIPAFSGLGTPYVRPDVRGAIIGITRGTRRENIIRGLIEGVAMRCSEVIGHVEKVSGVGFDTVLADGGLSKSDEFLQALADLSRKKIVRPRYLNGSAYGAYMISKLVNNGKDIIDSWAPPEIEKEFIPGKEPVEFKKLWDRGLNSLINP